MDFVCNDYGRCSGDFEAVEREVYRAADLLIEISKLYMQAEGQPDTQPF
jgi:hypothetical protein